MKHLYILLVTFLISSCATSYVSPDSKILAETQVAYIKVKNSGAAYPNWSSSIHRVIGNA